MTKTLLSLDNVKKVFYTDSEETVAIDKLSFSVTEGEFVVILGPSGCGKSTILSLICGLLTATEGNIDLNSTNAVGYMLQRDHLFDWRTIKRNILLGPEIKGKVTADTVRYVDTLLSKYGLKEFENFYPSQLSGGMRQRVALIRTLAVKPDLLLLDEPFSSLDFQTRLQVCDDVFDIIKKEGKTTVMVTHDISEAISIADRIIVLTRRPARILGEYQMSLAHLGSPLKRRESADFSKLFEKLYNLLKGDANDN